MYGIKKFIVIAVIFGICSCNPYYRFSRLVAKYPFLLDSVSKSKIIIRENNTFDTLFIWENEVDTILFPQATIERKNDTFRFYFRERNCTTYNHTTEIRPSKTIERYIESKSEKTQAWEFFKLNFHWFLITICLLLLLIKRR